MDITLTIADDLVPRVRDAFCGTFNYQELITDPATGAQVVNPETKLAFFRRMLREHIRGVVREYEAGAAAAAARSDVNGLDI